MPPLPGKALLLGFISALLIVTMALIASPRAAAAEVSASSGTVSARLLYEPAVDGAPIALEVSRAGAVTRFESLEHPEPGSTFAFGISAVGAPFS